MPSWEYYQQTEAGNQFQLYWICGLPAAYSRSLLGNFKDFNLSNLGGVLSRPTLDTLIAVPFDQLKGVTVSKILIGVRSTRALGAVSLAIYENVRGANNFPGTRIWPTNGNQNTVVTINQLGIRELPTGGVALRANTRYWAVLLANQGCRGGTLLGLGNTTTPVIFWGAKKTEVDVPTTGIAPLTGIRRPFDYANDFPDPWPADAEGNVSEAMDFDVPMIALAFSTVAPPRPANMEQGDIDGNVPPDTFTPGGAMVGTLSAIAVYVGGTYYGATAYQDLGTVGNTSSVTFNYQGTEAAGGATAGVRWDDSAQEGIFAFIDSTGPTLKIYEMSSGWIYVQDASTLLTLTPGNGYTLTLADNGSVVTASITDDSGVQTCSITTSLNTGNTETLFGWVGTTANYVFNAAIVGVTASQTGTVATPEIYPAAGTYMYAPSAFLLSTTGASIYYTTDGSTPTSASTLYTGPIFVTASETIKAIGILAGWTNSSVATAAYTINTAWTMEAGSIDGNTSGSFTPTGSDYGTLSASTFFASTWNAATAYYDLGTSNNGVSVTFTYQGAEGGGGVAAGLRWDNSAQEGDFAFLDQFDPAGHQTLRDDGRLDSVHWPPVPRADVNLREHLHANDL